MKSYKTFCKIVGVLSLVFMIMACETSTNTENPTKEPDSTAFGTQGAIQLFDKIITPSDPTTFQNVSYEGREIRTIFDRRIGGKVSINAYLFNAVFNDDLSAEVIVNPEFVNSDSALAAAKKYV